MRNTVLDTRDLIETRDALKQEILDSFNEDFEEELDGEELDDYDDIEIYDGDIDIQYFLKNWQEEISHIEEIDYIEEYCTDFIYGATLIHEDYFTYYCKELCEDCGYISSDFPSWIEIDWDSTAENIKSDYTSITYQDEKYYVR